MSILLLEYCEIISGNNDSTSLRYVPSITQYHFTEDTLVPILTIIL